MNMLDLKMRNAACELLASRANNRYVFLDIGATGGPERPAFRYLCKKNLIHYVGIEPQEESCNQLKKDFPNGLFLNTALGNYEGKATINIAFGSTCSSIRMPNFQVLNNYPIGMYSRIIGQEEITLTTGAQLIEDNEIPSPHFLKCDVQGYDYEVLEGFGDHLNSCT